MKILILIALPIIWLALAVASISGWFMNIFALIWGHHTMLPEEFWLRIVGIPVAVLGAILGWVM